MSKSRPSLWRGAWLALALSATACGTIAPALTSAIVAFGQDLLSTAAINYSPRYAESVSGLLLALAQQSTGVAFADVPPGYLDQRRQQLQAQALYERQMAGPDPYGQPPGYGYGQETAYAQNPSGDYWYGQTGAAPNGQTGAPQYGQGEVPAYGQTGPAYGQTDTPVYGQSAPQNDGYGQSVSQGYGNPPLDDGGYSAPPAADYGYPQSATPGAGYAQPGTSDYGYAQSGTNDYGYAQPGTDGYGYDQRQPGSDGYAQTRGIGDAAPSADGLTLSVALLAETRSPSGTVGLRPVADGEVLRDGGADPTAGDKIKLSFRGNCDCFLYVIGIDATGWVTRLYPAPGDPAVPLTAQADYLLPAGDVWWGLDRYKGVEQIYFLLSLERRADLESALAALPVERPPIAAAYRSVRDPAIVPVRGLVQVQSAAPATVPTAAGPARITPAAFAIPEDSADLVVTRWFHHQ